MEEMCLSMAGYCARRALMELITKESEESGDKDVEDL